MFSRLGGRREVQDPRFDPRFRISHPYPIIPWTGYPGSAIVVFMDNTEITTQEIESLRTSAGEAGDSEQVAICDLALEGDEDAIAECARVIARAQEVA